MRRLLAGSACLLMMVLASPADAASGNDRVVIEGPVTIGPGQRAGDVVVAHGNVTVARRGQITGDLVVASGKVRILGTVRGDAVSIADRAVLGRRARVGGDLLYGDKKPTVPSGASVGGDVKRVDIGKATGGLGLAAGAAIWLAVSMSAFLLGLLLLWLFPRAGEAVFEVAAARTGAAIGFGLLAFFLLPILGLLLLVTIVGLPLGLLLLLALAPFYSVAYTASAWALGRRMLGPERNRFLAFLAGLAILRVLALIPVLGGLVWFGATVFGLGLLLLAAHQARAGRGPAGTPAPAAA
ncbi:MAG: polymer-forming cytoskeletal protein [Actinomycetota bacterium]|nr:polymer-forming cytoskeletal protein [Actinomycetota bacterium]